MRIFYLDTEGTYLVNKGDYVFYKLNNGKSLLRQVNKICSLTGVYEDDNDKGYLDNVLDPNEDEFVTKDELYNTILNYRTQSATHAFWNYALEYDDTESLPGDPGLYILPASVVEANLKLPNNTLSANALLRVTEYKENPADKYTQIILEFLQVGGANGEKRRYAVCQTTKGQQGNLTNESWAIVLLDYNGTTIESLMNDLGSKIADLNSIAENRMVPSLVMNNPEGTMEVDVEFNDGTFKGKGLIITYGSLTTNLGHELNTLTLRNLSSSTNEIYRNDVLGLIISKIQNDSGTQDILIQSNNEKTCLIYNVYKIDII